jgi:uncharacterized protein
LKRKVLISGGTGLIGQALTALLLSRGYEVAHLSRRANPFVRAKAFKWAPHKNYIDENAFEGVTDLVHLAGAGIAEKKWTKARKEELIYSRIKTAELLHATLEKQNMKLLSFTGACAVGYYGAVTSEHIFTEVDKHADDFLGTVCHVWEASYRPIADLGIRTNIIRTATVLSDKGGALPKLVAPIRSGLGAPLGTGNQYVPWIHINDIAGIYLKAIEDEKMQGPVIAAAPQHTTNEELMRDIAGCLKKKLWPLNVPAFVLKLMLGEMADMVLEGSRVDSGKIIRAGYEFQFTTREKALENILKK